MPSLGKNPNFDTSPKRAQRGEVWDGLFPYYAGFSEKFALDTLRQITPLDRALIWDPFNGSGTTTFAAQKLGARSIGSEINPIMVIAAKARLFPNSELPSLRPIAAEITRHAQANLPAPLANDPLHAWYSQNEILAIRSLLQAILDLTAEHNEPFDDNGKLRWSCLTALLLSCLFSTMRQSLAALKGSNPTWVRGKIAESDREQRTFEEVIWCFEGVVDAAHAFLSNYSLGIRTHYPELLCARCEQIELQGDKPNIVLTSPPYLTRIDYAVSTRIEVALLQPISSVAHDSLRRDMMGTTLSPRSAVDADKSWGTYCNEVLEKIKTHPSKASSTYYHQTYADYFSKLYESIAKITNESQEKSVICMVLQDSFYKEIHVDLQRIVSAMMTENRYSQVAKRDFVSRTSMAYANPKSHYRRLGKAPTESLLVFQ